MAGAGDRGRWNPRRDSSVRASLLADFRWNVACQVWIVLRKSAGMTCPSCNSPLESTARFCGVCGYRLAPNRPPVAMSSGLPQASKGIVRVPRAQPGQGQTPPPEAKPADPNRVVLNPSAQAQAQKQAARAAGSKPRTKSADDIYLNEVLNNRFKVESKIG